MPPKKKPNPAPVEPEGTPIFDPGRPMTRAYSRELGLAGGNPESSGDLHRASSGHWSVTDSGTGEGPRIGSVPRGRSSTPSGSSGQTTTGGAAAGGATGGLLRCQCDGFILTPQDQILECTVCHNWSHAICVSNLDSRLAQTRLITKEVRAEFICYFCGDSSRGKRNRSVGANGTRDKALTGVGSQVPKVEEVADKPPNAAELVFYDLLLSRIHAWAKSKGYALLTWGSLEGKTQRPLTEKQIDQLLACCKSSIRDATFSEQYPTYCFKEQKQAQQQQLAAAKEASAAAKKAGSVQPGTSAAENGGVANTTPTGVNINYLQMSALKDLASDRLVSCVISNGMDPYGNLKSTITGLKTAFSRGLVALTSPASQASTSGPAANSSNSSGSSSSNSKRNAKKEPDSPAASPINSAAADAIPEFNLADNQGLMVWRDLAEVADFVHYTMVITSDDHRGKGLAKILMIVETIRWLKRGRTRGYVNMALTKTRGEKDEIICGIHPASRKLYESCGFMEVHPKYGVTGGSGGNKNYVKASSTTSSSSSAVVVVVERFTKKEADAGRLMGVLDAKAGMLKALASGFPSISTSVEKDKEDNATPAKRKK